MNVILVLFVLYVVVTAFQMRRAIATKEPVARRREAVRMLAVSALGVPLLVALIFVA